ncbi:hypothetical protein DSM107007_54290 [Nostoc sp. PCC 7120 = FACHB-418]|nr:hypothetical protein DSM107007_54290 [Nostoc sp. PCC 7120 = FACHB-418]
MPDSEKPKQVNNNNLQNAQFGGGLINADTVNAQRIGGDIWNFFFGQQLAPEANFLRPENQRLVLADVKHEVNGRLKQSLHNTVLINLGKELQLQQVKRYWDAEIKIGTKPPEPVSENTTILSVFDSEEIAGELLILGAPGAGKTTTQLELAQALIKQAEENPTYPIPVLINLSSWKDKNQPISEWLVVELKSKYGITKQLSQHWLINRQLLLLLDGLDEVKPIFQEACVKSINQLVRGEYRSSSIVICSRSQEYQNYKTNLRINGAICLKPLTKKQINKYLIEINNADLWETINNDFNLLELVKSPLLLSITIIAAREISLSKWQHLESTQEHLEHLLNAYVQRMLTREINSNLFVKNKAPNAARTCFWLGWLAQNLQRESQTEFLIEKMQPSWLADSILKKQYRVQAYLIGGLVVLCFSLVVGLIAGLIGELLDILQGFGLIEGLIAGLCIGLISAPVFGVFFGLNKEIKPIETLIWSWKRAKLGFKNGLVLAAKIGMFITIFCLIIAITIDVISNGVAINFHRTIVLIYAVMFGLIFDLFFTLLFGLLLGLLFALNDGLVNLEMKAKVTPNQGISNSVINAGVHWDNSWIEP